MTFDLDGDIQKLGAKLGEQTIKDADIKLTARGNSPDMKQFKLTEYSAELAQGGQSAFTLSGSGAFDAGTKDMDLQVVLRSTLSKLLAMFQPAFLLTMATNIAAFHHDPSFPMDE